MNPVWYQVLHPWHWLTYGQNATALGVVVAIVGTIVLYFYTRYTRRMMKTQSIALQMQESALRATITPKLVAHGDVDFVATQLDHAQQGADIGLQQPTITLYNGVLTIRNVGVGAALFLKGWTQPVSDKFDASNSSILGKTAPVTEAWPERTTLMMGESTSVTFAGFK